MRHSIPHIIALAAPHVLFQLARLQAVCSVSSADGLFPAQSPNASLPTLLSSLLSHPLPSASWRQEAASKPTVSGDGGTSTSFASSLPHVQASFDTDSGPKTEIDKKGETEETVMNRMGKQGDHPGTEGSSDEMEAAASDGAEASSEDGEVRPLKMPFLPAKRKPGGYRLREGYRQPPFLVESLYLDIVLGDEVTQVASRMVVRRREGALRTDLVLDGEDLELLSLVINGKSWTGSFPPTSGMGGAQKKKLLFESEGRLVIPNRVLPQNGYAHIVIDTVVNIRPKANLKRKGLFVLDKLLVTQCEPEGFRRMTYFLDRPDVLTFYTVRVEADEEKYPVLLSNGNKVACGRVVGSPGRHFVVFEDPFPKSSYLFGLVAGNLGSVKDSVVTKSGKLVRVELFSEPFQLHKLSWALESLKKSMKWDEEAFGREYDLNALNLVCVRHFNAEATASKGLYIFNCNLLLADLQSTTDTEYENLAASVAQKYFYNWTGCKVAIRDWFQLPLKEGLTKFREQLFMSVAFPSSIQRIQAVSALISRQFREDDSPMAHPIQPEICTCTESLYTSTVSDKGAEVIRMYHTILGAAGFRKGMDLYFRRHEGQAVTSDDLRAAMEDANGVDLGKYGRWYTQAGTPRLELLQSSYDPQEHSFDITLKQNTLSTPDQPFKLPQVIPIKLGLIGKTSKQDLFPPFVLLEMTEPKQTFHIHNVHEDCVPSLLRDSSAPVKVISSKQSLEDLAFLVTHDVDAVNRWKASVDIVTRIIRGRLRLANKRSVKFEPLPNSYIAALRETLAQKTTDNALKAVILDLPKWDLLVQELKPVDPEALHAAMRSVALELSTTLRNDLIQLYKRLALARGKRDQLTQSDIGRRKLRNVVLRLLSEPRDKEAARRALDQYEKAGCMTDRYAALLVLADMPHEEREKAFANFYEESKGNPLLVDKWFEAQAASDLPDQVERLTELQKHKDFSFTNPNQLHAAIHVFGANGVHFHRRDGKGYKLVCDTILEVDKHNPFEASRLAKLFMSLKDYTFTRQNLMTQQLRRLLSVPSLSASVREVVSKVLGVRAHEA